MLRALDFIRLTAAGLLFWALGTHTYDYYDLLRWVVTPVAAFTAFQLYVGGKRGLAWLLAAVALVFNPLLPIHLGRGTWAPIDLAAGALLLAAIPVLRRAHAGHQQVRAR